MEEWRAVVGFEGAYEVSSEGRLRSLDRTVETRPGIMARIGGRTLKLAPGPNGYPRASLNDGTGARMRYVHRLVCEAFYGPAGGRFALHENGVRTDNRIENLRWGDRLDNGADAVRLGEAPSRSNHGMAKLTEGQVAAIRADDRYVRAIAADYGVSKSLVSAIKLRRIWK